MNGERAKSDDSIGQVSSRERLRSARDEMYRELILDAAERVFAEDGFVGAKMQRVASEAGVSTSTVYASFGGGKEALHAAVHARRGAELLDAVTHHPDARGEPLARLLGGVGVYTRYLMEHPHYLRLLGHAKVWYEAASLDSDTQVDTSTRGLSLIERAFADGARAGVFRDEDPVLLARLMQGSHQVRLLDWLARGMEAPPNEVVRRLQRELICSFCVPSRIVGLLERFGLSE